MLKISISTLQYLLIIQFFCLKLIVCVNYCKLRCPGVKDDNTACRCYSGNAKCKIVNDRQDEFRQWIIDVHNKLRNEFASGEEALAKDIKTANMLALSYDGNLEHTAYCHARLCKFGHDKCRRTERYAYAGQNIHMSGKSSGAERYNTKNAVEKAVHAWYSEIKSLKLTGEHSALLDKFKNVPGATTGHFTQVIWAKTERVGCARVIFADGHKSMLTCNYGPGGNIMGLSVIKRGDPCSDCGSVKCNKDYPALCGEANIYSHGQTIKQTNIVLFVFILFCCTIVFI